MPLDCSPTCKNEKCKLPPPSRDLCRKSGGLDFVCQLIICKKIRNFIFLQRKCIHCMQSSTIYVQFMYNICSIYVHFLNNICTIFIQKFYSIFSIVVQYMYNSCTIVLLNTFNSCTVYVQFMYNICTIYVQ